ncbi:MAG: phosphoglycerate dehydrogenase [Betaproteobacteria bacterium]|nr:phosphoglycerate dehydrogenase [Betaproteobacteria bacterium]
MANPQRILTLNQISSKGLSRFPAEYTVGPEASEPDAVLVRSHNMHEMEIPTSVKAIGRAGAGTNNIPVKLMSARGVPVFNAPGANANAVKELVVAGMLMAARNLIPAVAFVDSLTGDDAAIHKHVESGKKRFAGIELPNRTLGIVGLGAIGSLVAEAAIRLGMNVLGYDPEITVEAAWRLPSQARREETIDEVMKNSDFITLHVPLLDVTRDLVNAERVALMRQGTILLNFAREGIVNEEAVLAGLASGKLKSYVCDFPSRRLAGQAGVVALPHLGASTQEAEENCAVMVVDQVTDYLEHGNILHSVNFPNITMARESPFRVAIANANVPNMVGQISTAMARAGLNISNMVNKSKGEMAYTLVDTDSPITPNVIEAIRAVPGVLMVRSLPRGA